MSSVLIDFFFFFFFFFFFCDFMSDFFFIKANVVWYSFELLQLVETIQMSTNKSVSDDWCLTINVCGRTPRDPASGFLVFWLH